MRVRTWRQIHRILGLVIGIQLLLWTVSGLIFSWNSIRSVRGEDMVREPGETDLRDVALASPLDMQFLKEADSYGSQAVVAIEFRTLSDRVVCEWKLDTGSGYRYVLFDATTGKQVSPIGKELAVEIARNDFSPDCPVRSVSRITSTSGHSEYRKKELPVWRVTMDHPTNTSIYVSAERGLVTARRNDQWRRFDFFWMLHTMDYQGRDNFNHWLLRAVSIFGVATVLSGFALWLMTSPWFRRLRKRSARPTSTA